MSLALVRICCQDHPSTLRNSVWPGKSDSFATVNAEHLLSMVPIGMTLLVELLVTLLIALCPASSEQPTPEGSVYFFRGSCILRRFIVKDIPDTRFRAIDDEKLEWVTLILELSPVVIMCWFVEHDTHMTSIYYAHDTRVKNVMEHNCSNQFNVVSNANIQSNSTAHAIYMGTPVNWISPTISGNMEETVKRKKQSKSSSPRKNGAPRFKNQTESVDENHYITNKKKMSNKVYNMVGYRSAYFVSNKEKCPLNNSSITSKWFDHTGGEMTLDDYAVKLTVPKGAIKDGYGVEIQLAASFCGPFSVPKVYRLISPYIWIGNSYKFKKQLELKIEHHAYMSCAKDTSKLCILKTHENSDPEQMHKVMKGYQFKSNDSFCTYSADHFCTVCLATNRTDIPLRILVYHYLPKDYKLTEEFISEVCFCYDLKVCRQRIEKCFVQRNMIKNASYLILDYLKNDDKFLLSDLVTVGNWNVIFLKDKLSLGEIDFQELCNCDGDSNVFPHCLKVKLNCHGPSLLDVNFNLNILRQSESVKVCTFNIFIRDPTRKVILRKLQVNSRIGWYDIF